MKRFIAFIAAALGLSLMFLSKGYSGIAEVQFFIIGLFLGVLGTVEFICS